VIAAAPPAPQREAVQAWEDVYRALEADLRKWTARAAAGNDPLTPTELSKVRSLVAAVKVLRPMSDDLAQMTAGAMVYASDASDLSLKAALDALPKHVVQSAAEAAEQFGWANIPNQQAVAQVVAGNSGELTGDFSRLTTDVQARLVTDVATSVAVGESPKDLAVRIAKSLEPSFLDGQSRSVTIARTVLARAYDQSSLMTYREAAAQGILHGWRWVARPGACDVCRALHGSVWTSQTDTYRHPNCTCVVVPVLMDEAAANVAYGDRYDPFPGTSMNDVELRTSSSGWTSWHKKPKAEVESLDFAKDIDKILAMTPDSYAKYGMANQNSLALLKATGMDGKPKVVSKDWDSVPGEKIYRAVNGDADDYFDQFKNGDPWTPNGTYGSGTYFGTSRSSVVAEYGKAGLLEARLSPDAKIVDILNTDEGANWRAWKFGMKAKFDGHPNEKKILYLLDDPSTWAILRGYDAIVVDPLGDGVEKYLVILNREMVTVRG
jgi:hypothetical protein